MDPATAFEYKGRPTRIHVGDGALENLPKALARAGAERAITVCGNTVAHETDLLDRIEDILGDKYVGFYDGVESESPLPSVEAGVDAVTKADADIILAVGGGSTIVTTRAITIFLAEDGDPREICTQYPDDGDPISPRLEEPKMPNVVIMTTPTTAANRPGTAIQDHENSQRLEYYDPKTTPKAVFVDPDALATAPKWLYRNTSASTFNNLMGKFQAPELNAFKLADLTQSLRQLKTYLPDFIENPDNPDTRIQLALAPLFINRAGQSRGTAGWTGSMSSGLVHQLQILHGTVHQGEASSTLLAPGMRYNRDVLLDEQHRLAEIWGIADEDATKEENVEAVTNAIEGFLNDVGMPTRLRELEIEKDDLELIAEQAMEDFFLQTNPKEVSDRDELIDVLHEAW